MEHIHKHPILLTSISELAIHEGASFLSFQLQHGALTSWWLEDRAAPKETIRFRVYPTGAGVEPGDIYLGTLQDAQYVWHLFRTS